MIEAKFKLVHPAARLPEYATAGAACFDLVSIEEGHLSPGCMASFRTGLQVEVPPGYAMMLYSRSGHGFKHGVRLCNGVGVIDSDYRGEIAVGLHNDWAANFYVRAGDRIAQAMIVPAPQCRLILATDLSSTDRGAGGFGSTGK